LISKHQVKQTALTSTNEQLLKDLESFKNAKSDSKEESNLIDQSQILILAEKDKLIDDL